MLSLLRSQHIERVREQQERDWQRAVEDEQHALSVAGWRDARAADEAAKEQARKDRERAAEKKIKDAEDQKKREEAAEKKKEDDKRKAEENAAKKVPMDLNAPFFSACLL